MENIYAVDNVVGYPKTQFQPLNSGDSSGIELSAF